MSTSLKTTLKSAYDTLCQLLTPTTIAWRGATEGVIALGTIVVVLVFYFSVLQSFSFQKLPAFIVTMGAPALIGLAVCLGAYSLMSLPKAFRLGASAIAPLLIVFTFPGGELTGLVGGLGSILIFALIGGASSTLVQSKSTILEHPLAIVSLILGVGLTAVGLYAVFSDKDIANPALENYVLADKTLDLPNPGLPGIYEVERLTYGSGKDIRRDAYSVDVDVISRTVDGSKLIDNWEGFSGWLRTSYWGFDVTELPLQARVWQPKGDGPFPLVLIVHGNHGMEDFSDPGYDYLGELFASRGIILASVDENFINSSYSAQVDILANRAGLVEENDARGWLLLEHLSQFRDWNEAPDNPFYQKIDMDKLALMGHSRGGEAVGVAAAFNTLSRYPDDASLEFDFNFNLKGVIAISPVYGQYQPRERYTPINDVNYLTVHGDMDGDVQSFEGAAQYSRVKFSGDDYRFRSSLYIVGANHGQFNTTWENIDISPFRSWSLDTSRIMPRQDQRDVARVYFSAFLEVVLNDNHDYLPLFKDARYGANWLPNTFFINQFSDSSENIVVDFENDLELTTLDIEGGTVTAENLSRWHEVANEMKYDDLDTHSLVVAWDDEVHEEIAEISFSFAQPRSGNTLVLSVSPSDISTKPRDWEENEEDGGEENENSDGSEAMPNDDENSSAILDWTIAVVDSQGNQADLLLSRDSPLYPLIKATPYRASFLVSAPATENLFRRFEYPLAAFEAANPQFNGEQISQVKFIFDQVSKGALMLDSIALD